MENQNVPIMGIIVLFFFLLCGVTATSALVTAPPTATTAASVSSIAANMADELHAPAPSLSKCSCCLAHQDRCTKTINIWGIMSAEDAKEFMPIVYLARQEIMDTRQLPRGWNINISFLNSNGTSGLASARAYETYTNVTQKCLPKLTGSYSGEAATDARGGESLASADGQCDPVTSVPDVGVFLVARDYEVPKVASLASRWQIAVLSPGASSETMADPKYSSLYRLHGDSSQVGNSVTLMAAEWNWTTAYLVYQDEEQIHKCYAAMMSIRSKLCAAQGASNNNCKIKSEEFDQQIKKDVKNKETENFTKKFLKEITEKNRIVFTCFTNDSSLTEFYKEANAYDENVYAFINLDLVSSKTNEKRPWTEEGTVNRTISPRLVITSRSPPEDLSTKMKIILSETDQKELQDMCGTLMGESDTSKPPANSGDPFFGRLVSQISSPILEAQNHALNKSECDPLVMNLPVQPSVASVYDGVWFFVEAFNRALEGFNGSQNFSEAVLSKLSTSYTSKLRKQTYSVINRTLPDDLVLMYLDSNSKYKEAGLFQIHGNITNVTFKDNGIYTPPRDEPECGFKNEYCMSALEKAIIVLGCFLGILAVCFAVVLWLNRHSQKQKERVWLIPTSEMDPAVVKMARERSNGGTESSITDWKAADCDYKGEKVHVKYSTKKITLTDDLKQDLQNIKVLKHSNIVRFLGACVESSKIMLVTEFCSRGSLKKLLEHNFPLKNEDCIKYPLTMDLISGMSFLHKSVIKVHGNLRSRNCLIDSRLVLKLSGFGLPALRPKAENSQSSEKQGVSQESQPLVDSDTEMDPTQEDDTERREREPANQDQDIYAVGVILREIFPGSRKEPSAGTAMGSSSGGEPYLSMSNFAIEDDPEKTKKLDELIKMCKGKKSLRPPIEHIRRKLKEIFKNKGKSLSLVHDLLSRLEHYASNLEATADERSKDILQEKEKWKSLLHDILPESVATEMIKQRGNDAKINKPQIAEFYEQATVFFSDIVDFAAITAQIEPMEVVNLLNNLYSKFDEAINEEDVYKVETIGDAYVVASGLPHQNGTEHAALICSMALKFLEVTQQVEAPHKPGESLQIRIGINSGSCVAGVTGIDKPRYCIFGDTVNTASRMESSGLPMKIHISESTYAILKENYPRFRVEERGYVELKGKGLVKTYWLLEERKKEETDDLFEWSQMKISEDDTPSLL